MINLLLAASLSGALPVTASDPVDATPAMFVVRDRDTTIYLFGTFHALDGQSDWFSGNLRTAFDSSQELVLETIVPDGNALAPLPTAVRRPMFNYSAAPSASFLATTRLALSAGKSRGMNVANGADMVLRHVAEAEGKQVEGLETLDLQLRMFERMPSAAPTVPQAPAAPVSAGGPLNDLSNAMSDMQTAWKRGDQTVFVRMLDQLRRGSPETYRMMFTERNARWADWIAARMQTPGTVFVAVGAGHLAGKDSVLVRLAEHGIESSRLN
ncbi:uncharacterized protein ACUXST_000934 [Sphingomonas sp. F9_3S_D5_B_2]